MGDFVLGDERTDLCDAAGEAGGARGDTPCGEGTGHLLELEAAVGLSSRGDTEGALLLFALVGSRGDTEGDLLLFALAGRARGIVTSRRFGVFADVGADLLIRSPVVAVSKASAGEMRRLQSRRSLPVLRPRLLHLLLRFSR